MPLDDRKTRPGTSAKSLWLLSALIFFSNGTVYGAWATQVPIIKARLGVTESELGALLMAMGAGALGAMILSGWLIPKVGAARLIVIGMVGFIASFVALALTSSAFILAIALLSFGATGGLMDVAMNAHAGESERQIGRPVMSSIHGTWNIGGLAGSGLGGLLLSLVSGPVQATLIAAGLVLLLVLVRSRLNQADPRPSDNRSGGSRRSHYVWILGALAFLSFTAEASIRDWSSLYLNLERHIALAMAGWGFSVCSALMAVGRIAGDYGRARWGDKRMVVGSGLVAALGFGLATAASSITVVFTGFALIGLGLSNIVPTMISSAARLPNQASSITVVVAMGYSGYLISPPILGGIISATSLGTMFQCIGVVCVLIAASWFALSYRQR